MKKYRVVIIVLLIFTIGIVSWSLCSRKSLDQIKQHATLVKVEPTEQQISILGRYQI